MLDDDTFILPTTFAAAIEGKDPEKPFYLGRRIGGKQHFAYGGAGIVFSRGAMKIMFGESKESAAASASDAANMVLSICCGDLFTAQYYSEKIGDKEHFEDDLESDDVSKFFQGMHPLQFISAFNHWCDPIGSFHHGNSGEYDAIGRWYDSLVEERGKSYRPTYYDYYEEYIMPHVAPELDGWIAKRTTKKGVITFSSEEAPTKWKCKELCEADERCMQWSFSEGDKCKLIRDGVVAGQAFNEYSPDWNKKVHAMGYMVSRIIDNRKNPENICDPMATDQVVPLERTEGWLLRKLESGPIPPQANSYLYV